MTKVATIDNKQLADAYEERVTTHVRDQARVYTEKAIDTLAKIMRNTKVSPSVRRAAAKDLLDQGWGRPDNRADQAGGDNQGITIIINKLSTGGHEIVDVEEVKEDLIEAKKIAEVFAESE